MLNTFSHFIHYCFNFHKTYTFVPPQITTSTSVSLLLVIVWPILISGRLSCRVQRAPKSVHVNWTLSCGAFIYDKNQPEIHYPIHYSNTFFKQLKNYHVIFKCSLIRNDIPSIEISLATSTSKHQC